MRTTLLLALAPIAFAAPALAQGMDQSMPGMNMPMPAAKPGAKPSPKAAHRHRPHRNTRRAHHPAPASSAAEAHAGHDMAGMPGMTMPAQGSAGMTGMQHDQTSAGAGGMAAMPGMKGMDMSSQPTAPAAEEPVGNQPPPPPPTDYAADRVFGPAAMAGPRTEVHREHGGGASSMVLANIAEYQARKGGGGYRWEGEASFGGDINRLFLKSEGEGTTRSGVDAAEIQALYSRAVGPYFNLQAGVRQDIRPTPARTYATFGFEGLAPYWFEVSGAAFISTRGEALGRFEGYDDFRITQRLILQPRAELNLSAQNIPELGIGSGVSNLELGLRLRYEIRREFAPYIGVSYDRKFGATADYARARGERAGTPAFVVGIRTFF